MTTNYTYFDASTIRNLDDLKKAYRRLAMRYHPDVAGDTPENLAAMKAINDEHDRLFEVLKARQNAAADAGEGRHTDETAEDFRRVLLVLLKLDGLTIELCGRWLWVGGDTRTHKEALKAAGLKWCSKKKLWSWHPAEEPAKRRRGGSSMAQIRTKYGSKVIRRSAGQPEPEPT